MSKDLADDDPCSVPGSGAGSDAVVSVVRALQNVGPQHRRRVIYTLAVLYGVIPVPK